MSGGVSLRDEPRRAAASSVAVVEEEEDDDEDLLFRFESRRPMSMMRGKRKMRNRLRIKANSAMSQPLSF